MKKSEKKKFYVSYISDETLPLHQCHKGSNKYETKKRSRFFDITKEGITQGKEFLKECKHPITKPKSLLFLEKPEKGKKIMTEIRRKENINSFLKEPSEFTLEVDRKNVISLEELKEELGY